MGISLILKSHGWEPSEAPTVNNSMNIPSSSSISSPSHGTHTKAFTFKIEPTISNNNAPSNSLKPIHSPRSLIHFDTSSKIPTSTAVTQEQLLPYPSDTDVLRATFFSTNAETDANDDECDWEEHTILTIPEEREDFDLSLETYCDESTEKDDCNAIDRANERPSAPPPPSSPTTPLLFSNSNSSFSTFSSSSISSTCSRDNSYGSWPMEWPDPPPRKFIDWFCAKAFSNIGKPTTNVNTQVVVPLATRPNSSRRSSKRTLNESLPSNVNVASNTESGNSNNRKKRRTGSPEVRNENLTITESKTESKNITQACQHCQCRITQTSSSENSIDLDAETIHLSASLDYNATLSLPSERCEISIKSKPQRSLSAGSRTRKTRSLIRQQSLISKYFTSASP